MSGSSELGATEREKLSVRVVQILLTEIADGTLPVGASLPSEPDLIDRFDVSRSTIREAIQTIAAKGFLSVRQGRVATVAPRYYWNVLDPAYIEVSGGRAGLYESLLEARMFVEPTIAGLAAKRITDSQLSALRAALDDMHAASGSDLGAFAESDLAFHGVLADASQNRVLVAMHSTITQLGRLQREDMAHDASSVARSNFWHGQILSAMESSDEVSAEAAMRLHLRQVMEDLGRAAEAEAK